MSKEKWKDIPGFESCYQASSFGRIRSKKRVVVYSNGAVYKYPSKVLVPGITLSGYYTLTLCKDTLRYSRRVCRLIAKTFIKNPFNKLHIITQNLFNNAFWRVHVILFIVLDNAMTVFTVTNKVIQV